MLTVDAHIPTTDIEVVPTGEAGRKGGTDMQRCEWCNDPQARAVVINDSEEYVLCNACMGLLLVNLQTRQRRIVLRLPHPPCRCNETTRPSTHRAAATKAS